jgi:tetratricopeptide (TPR) repeat protein
LCEDYAHNSFAMINSDAQQPSSCTFRPAVMLSSTSFDLPEHRKAADDAIERAECVTLRMEAGTAESNSNAIKFSLELVEKADIYVGIFGHRYGHVPDDPAANPSGLSVTELEYKRAKKSGIPVLVFVMHEDHANLKAKDFEREPEKLGKLEALKTELQRNEICAFFKSPEELRTLVIQALHKLRREQPRVAPSAVSAQPTRTLPVAPALYAVPPYTLTTQFVGRRAELREIDSWAKSKDTVLVVEAIGGEGKSALTWEWVQKRAVEKIPDLAGRMWWSFYERGTSMQWFVRCALAYTRGVEPDSLKDLSAHECGEQLLIELRRRPFLLVLDGFERVLAAYHRIDKAQVSDDGIPLDQRECTNPRDGELLPQLVQCEPSKILISSRLMPKGLEDSAGHSPIPGVKHLKLEGLSEDDALDLLHAVGVRGDDAELLRFAADFGRHALILRIVCGMVTNYHPAPGDFGKWLADPLEGGKLKLGELEMKQRKTHILGVALQGLANKTRLLLSRIAALSDASDYETVAALNPFLPMRSAKVLPTHPQQAQAITDFHAALNDLAERGLLQWDRSVNTYDLHPVVRAYSFERLDARGRSSTFDAIHDHFAHRPQDNYDEATELHHLRNSIEMMRALIGAGRNEAAARFYRGSFSQALYFSVGANHAIVELVRPLLADSSDGNPVLNHSRDRSYLTNDLALALGWLGRNEEAERLNYNCLALDLESANWESLAISIRNLSIRTLRKLNRLAAANAALGVARELCLAGGYEQSLTRVVLDQMAGAVAEGRFEEAKALHTTFLLCPQPVRSLYRIGEAEYWFAALSFHQGSLSEMELHYGERRALEGRNLWGQENLAILRGKWELTRGKATAALDAIDNALTITRRTGMLATEYLAIRATALARLKRTRQAREALAEATEHTSSHYIAEAWLALGEREKARECVQKAYRWAWGDGPPHIHWYELTRCREIMAELGESEPVLPPFDPSKIKPIPHEDEIRAVIERLKAEKDEK